MTRSCRSSTPAARDAGAVLAPRSSEPGADRSRSTRLRHLRGPSHGAARLVGAWPPRAMRSSPPGRRLLRAGRSPPPECDPVTADRDATRELSGRSRGLQGSDRARAAARAVGCRRRARPRPSPLPTLRAPVGAAACAGPRQAPRRSSAAPLRRYRHRYGWTSMLPPDASQTEATVWKWTLSSRARNRSVTVSDASCCAAHDSRSSRVAGKM